MEKITFNSFKFYILIFIFILLAHFPTLTGDFLKQDDWNATFWNLDIITSHPEFFNAALELFRPISILIILISDYITLDIENAKYVRLITIALMSLCAYITFKWQLKFKPNDKLLALSFAILAFCLPASHLHSSTTTYIHMVFALLCGQLGMVYFYKAMIKKQSNEINKKYLFFSSSLIMVGLLNYPPTAMIFFVFLLIYFLSNTSALYESNHQIYLFTFQAAFYFFLLMLLYLVLAKSIHFVFDVEPKLHGGAIRSVHIDWNIYNKILHIYTMVKASINSINLFFYDITTLRNIPSNFYILSFIFLTYCSGIFLSYFKKLNRKKNYIYFLKYFILIFIISFLLLILSYFPILAIDVEIPVWTTFRYTAVTAPFILYIFLWSINNIEMLIFKSNKDLIKSLLLLTILIFGVFKSNYVMNNMVVGPHVAEINHIASHIEINSSKFLVNNKSTIIIIRDNTEKNLLFNDYDLRINDTHNWLVSATIYLLRKYEINTIPSHKVLNWDEDKIHISSYWGDLISLNSLKNINLNNYKNKIIINMKNINK